MKAGPDEQATIVVGGGLGGLAAACTLAARGRRVQLFERRSTVGGKAAQLEDEGYRFDMGPTILTLPSVLRRIWSEAGLELEQDLELVRLDPQWRCFYSDGATLDLVADEDAMVRKLEAFAPGSGAGYRRFMERSARLHDISRRYYFWRSVGRTLDMFRLRDMLRPGTLADLVALSPSQTVASMVRGYVPEPRVAQMLDHFTQYVGSCPDSSPAVLCGIADMQTGEGVWYPRGGIGAVPAALERLARRLGVELHCDAEVTAVRHSEGRIRSVEVDGRTIEAEAVVVNADAVLAGERLLEPPGPLPANRFEPACSGVVLYLGLNRRYPQLLHHNFVFSKSPEEEFEAIYGRGEPAPDPTCYVCAPAATDPEVAPEGGEALYVLAHTPWLRDGQDWSQLLPEQRERILDKLEQQAGLEGLRDAIVVEHHLTPADIAERYQVWRGAIYGVASHGRLTGAIKVPNQSPTIAGLAFAGGAAHPGPGMPMVLMSGWIAADALTPAAVPG